MQTLRRKATPRKELIAHLENLISTLGRFHMNECNEGWQNCKCYVAQEIRDADYAAKGEVA
jgi:hypothetical protein